MIHKITAPTDLDALHAWCERTYEPTWVCSKGAPYPSRRHFDRYATGPYTIYAHDAGGFLVVSDAGKIMWLKVRRADAVTIAPELFAAAALEHSPLWGAPQFDAWRDVMLTIGFKPYPAEGPDAIVWQP